MSGGPGIHAAMQRYIDEKLVGGIVTLVAWEGRIEHFEAVGHRHV